MKTRLSFTVFAGITILAFVMSACSAPQANPQTDQSGSVVIQTPQIPETSGSITMNGAGATFPYPLYSRWFYEYAFIDPTVKYNYQSIGSGGGIKQITAKTVDFGASDAILNEEQFAAAPGIQMLPMVAGAVVPTYKLDDLKDSAPLVLDGSSLSAIFMGQITRWNDPAIAALNPGVTLPEKDIIVVHRSDGSGTSFIFTDYLTAVSPEWASEVGHGTSVEWPVGLGGKGNEGVAGTVSQNDGSIGYVELSYATQNKLSVAQMVNAAGNAITPSVETTQNAMADFGGEMPETLARSIVNAPGAQSWPIAGYTYLLVYSDQTDCTKAGKLVSFIRWALTDGSSLAEQLEYVPLPENVRQLVFTRLDQVTCNGQPLS